MVSFVSGTILWRSHAEMLAFGDTKGMPQRIREECSTMPQAPGAFMQAEAESKVLKPYTLHHIDAKLLVAVKELNLSYHSMGI